MQAYDRVHRLGQKRPVHVVYIMMEDSIEGCMVKMQEAKQALGKGCVEELSTYDENNAKLTTLKDLVGIVQDEYEDNVCEWQKEELNDDSDANYEEDYSSDDE
jgi:hypothetical protein